MIRRKKNNVVSVLLIMLLCLGIGYAALTTNLSINGSADVRSSNWDIHFENVQTRAGNITPTSAATINAQGNTVTYSVTLAKPGDYYEFTVDAKNAGTIDGMVTGVISKLNGSVITTLPSYLEYYVTYADGIEVENNHLLSANSTEKYLVHIGYKLDIQANQLPATAQSLTLSFSVEYSQANGSAVTRDVYKYSNYSNASYIGDVLFEVGSQPPAAVTLYNSPYDVVEEGVSTIFLRHKISDNKVVNSRVGYYINGRIYIVEARKYSELTQDEKNRIINSFVNGTCTDQSSILNCYYTGHAGISITSTNAFIDGGVNGVPWFCGVGFNDDLNKAACGSD